VIACQFSSHFRRSPDTQYATMLHKPIMHETKGQCQKSAPTSFRPANFQAFPTGSGQSNPLQIVTSQNPYVFITTPEDLNIQMSWQRIYADIIRMRIDPVPYALLQDIQ